MNETAILQTAPVGYIPSYSLYIAVGITILAVIILVYVLKGKTRNGIKFQDFWKAMAFTIIISGTITIGLAVAPEILTKLIDNIGGWWANL